MTQEQFDQRLMAAVVRLARVMQAANGSGVDIEVNDALSYLQNASAYARVSQARMPLSSAEECIDILAESLPPEARVLDAPLRDKVVALCFEQPAVAKYARENDIGAPLNEGMNYDNGDAK